MDYDFKESKAPSSIGENVWILQLSINLIFQFVNGLSHLFLKFIMFFLQFFSLVFVCLDNVFLLCFEVAYLVFKAVDLISQLSYGVMDFTLGRLGNEGMAHTVSYGTVV